MRQNKVCRARFLYTWRLPIVGEPLNQQIGLAQTRLAVRVLSLQIRRIDATQSSLDDSKGIIDNAANLTQYR